LSEFRTRRRGSPRQRGLRFPVDKASEAGQRQVQARERYLATLLKEGRGYDLNDVRRRLDGEAREATSALRKLAEEFRVMTQEAEALKRKIAVIENVLAALGQMQAAGRTRVGESDLKYLLRDAMGREGVDSQTLDF